MNTEEIWISVKTLAEIKNVTARAIRLALLKSKYVFREVSSSGGKSFEILLSSIEYKFQEIYKNKYYEKIVNFETEINSIPSIKQISTLSGFIPETAKTIALARVDLVLEWQKFRNKNLPRQKADKVFLDLYNSGEYLKNVFGIVGKTSRGSLQRWYRSYSKHENWEAIAPQYNYSSFNSYRTILTEEEIGIFLKLLLHPNKFSIGKAIKLTAHILEKREIENVPKPITFRRYAEYFKKNNYDKWILMREGEKALKDKILPYIKRDISRLEVGQV